ncbi:uncharacterized protein EDB93DRAFT_192172 [Suillus bovinus]|uniref:uncharacterized protein n=1 Tax=Suillus bovinus TaxID=48563 RepID=UPI001B86CC4A|nr:uncharacterized protein EDB93DRAFT_192172 [Suillus bovinus]KAG2154265.1 hypothetical protein EDB93DRAFT_192172 [Suillus bovinus]
MRAQFSVHFLNIVKKWLSQLARRSANSLSLFLPLLRRFVSGHLKLGACGRRLFAATHFSSEALLRSKGSVAREHAPTCLSSLPVSSSDDPYSRIHSQNSEHLRKSTAIPLSQTTTQDGSTAEIYGGSMSSLHQSLYTGESSGNDMDRPFPNDDPLEGSGSPGPSRSLGPYRLSRSHSRSQMHTNDDRFLVAGTPTSTIHAELGMTHSKYSLASQASSQSLTSSITGLRPHKGTVYHLPERIHSSIALQPAPPDLATGRVRYIAPPGSDKMPGPEIEVHEHARPGVFPMVARGVMRYERSIPR